MHILFDLDGTLSDPAEGILGSIRYALERLGATIPEESQLLRCIGPPLQQSFGSILQTEDRGEIDHAISLYRERFAGQGILENRLYSGIDDVLGTLVEMGGTLYVATSKPHHFANQIIDHFGLRKHFTQVYGSEMNGERSAKGELLAWLLEQERLSSDKCVMIGDRSHDVVGALEHSILPIGVLWGYGSHNELKSAGCRHFCERVEELPPLLKRLYSERAREGEE